MNNYSVLVIEDEKDILELIRYSLAREGFNVNTANNGSQGLSLVNTISPDLVVLDLMMPGMDGLELCKIIKKEEKTKNILVIIVSAKVIESDIVLGLGVGADDYLTKPFSPRELVARVKALLRRGSVDKNQYTRHEEIEIGNLHINIIKFTACLNNKKLNLTVTEFRLLSYLASHPGQAFSREQLLNFSLNEEAVVGNRNVDVHIRRIRQKMALPEPLIETIRSIGYRYKEPNDLSIE